MFDWQGQPSALEVLEGARAARSDPQAAEAAVLQAVEQAPDDFEIRQGAYKFYFYNNRLAEALPHAEAFLRLAARDINVSPDWRMVEPDGDLFGPLEKKPRRYLQTLVAIGYCLARTGRYDEALERLEKAAALDPNDRFAAARLASVIRTGLHEEEA